MFFSKIDFNWNITSALSRIFSLDQYGNIENDHNWPNLYLVEYAQARGVKVKLCATLFGYDNLTTLLSSQQNRQNAWINLANLVVMQNADGIDINFEYMS